MPNLISIDQLLILDNVISESIVCITRVGSTYTFLFILIVCLVMLQRMFYWQDCCNSSHRQAHYWSLMEWSHLRLSLVLRSYAKDLCMRLLPAVDSNKELDYTSRTVVTIVGE